MKFLGVLVNLTMIAGVIFCSSDSKAWENYKKENGKDYNGAVDGGKLDAVRKEVFQKNIKRIQRHNSGNTTSFKLEANKFADMLPAELAQYLGVKASLAPPLRFLKFTSVNFYDHQEPAATLDYRNHFCMPAVKDQRQCGSCWAFITITPLEFAKCIKRGFPVTLSEQQLVDCDKRNDGCSGGWYTTGWRYLKEAWGSANERFYPYNAQENTCSYSWRMAGAKVWTYRYVESNSEIAMRQALQRYGVLATAFSVIASFYSYADGIYDDDACDTVTVNHGLVIVGWGESNGVPYWIGRNSWGTNWGKNGYIYVKRGVNKCNIETYAAYVVPF